MRVTPEGQVICGDCVEVMATFDPDSVDAIVADPPYDLTSAKRGGSGIASINLDSPYGRARIGTGNGSGGFMGKAWDSTGVAFDPETWRQALRVAKPGAHLLAFGGTRTYHRLVAAIEDAGWEIRDCLVWAYASGFPKSLDVSKAIDKAAGVEREVVGRRTDGRYAYGFTEEAKKALGAVVASESSTGFSGEMGLVTAPATPEAARWQGWGTALKPAWEPIVLARKPFHGTVAANVLAHGTGALNIDATRIPIPAGDEVIGGDFSANGRGEAVPIGPGGYDGSYTVRDEASKGRWPANVVLTDEIFDGDMEGVVGGGVSESGKMMPTQVRNADRNAYGDDAAAGYTTIETYGDSGTYSRFFLIPKADRADREPIVTPDGHDRTKRFTTHPTVKPTDLMRHLVRLVTPLGGLVLDPFAGSGSTLLAAEAEGFRWLGIEKEADYLAIAEARLHGTQRGLGLDVAAPLEKRAKSPSHWPKRRTAHKSDTGFGFSGQEGLVERVEP